MTILEKLKKYLQKRSARHYTKDEKFIINQNKQSTIHRLRCSFIPYILFLVIAIITTLFYYTNRWYSFYQHNISFVSWLQHQQSLPFLLTVLVRFGIPSFLFFFMLYLAEAYLKDQIFKYRAFVLGESIDFQSISATDKYTDPKILKLKLTRMRKWRKSWIAYTLIVVLCGVLVYQIADNGYYAISLPRVLNGEWKLGSFLADYIPNVFVYVAPLSIFYALVLFFMELPLENRLNSISNDIVSDADGELVSEDIYSNSIKMSYKYLNQYYAQTRKQAENGFRITCIIAISGGLVIFGGIMAMFLGNAEPAYLTTATGVIIEFIASIFFYLYNKTMQNMGDYHNKLVLSQNIAIALEVVDDIEGDDKNKIKSEMVRELLKDINTHINENKPERKSDAIEHVKPELTTTTN